MSIDILAALAAGAPAGTASSACTIQIALDDIPDDTAGKDQLMAAVNGDTSAERMSIVLARLGIRFSATTIRRHRRRECLCGMEI